MSSVGHADTDTLAETVVGHEEKEHDPYEEPLTDTETVVDHDRKSLKSKKEPDSDSLMLVKTDAHYRYATFAEGSSRATRPMFFRVIGGIGSLPSRAINSVSSLAQRMLALCNAEIQVRGAVLANAAVIQRRVSQKGKLASTSRNMLTDIAPKQLLMRDKIRGIRSTLQDAKKYGKSASIDKYTELLLLLCIVLRAPARTYSETLIWRVWDTLTDELAGPHVLLVVDAMASVECLDEDIGTLLRHLALARLSGWKKQRALNSLDPTSILSLARSASFSSETYQDYLSLNEGFFALLLGVTSKRPAAVHEAFDDYVHLVWYKYATSVPPMAGWSPRSVSTAAVPFVPQIKFNYALDNIAYTLNQFEKRLDPSLSGEGKSFVHFIASTPPSTSMLLEKAPTPDYEKCAIMHVRKALACIADVSRPLPKSLDDVDPAPTSFSTDATYELLREHPGFALGSLAHPALPILLFVAELAEKSPRACTLLVGDSGDKTTRGFLDALRILWTRSFLLPWDYTWGTWEGTGPGPGRWVPKEKRSRALRVATCLVVANLVKTAQRAYQEGDPGPMRVLAEGIIAKPRLETWFWDVAAEALYFQIHFSRLYHKDASSEVPSSKDKQAETEVYGLYALSLEHVRPLITYLVHHMGREPPALNAKLDDIGPEHLVWIYEDVSAAVACKVFSSILTYSTAASEWSIALEILETCDSYNQNNFRAAISEFTRSLLSHRIQAPRRLSRMLAPSVRSYTFATDPPSLFMPHPADRFLILLASAIRRNRHIGIALQRDSNARKLMEQLLRDVEGGRFDAEIADDGFRPSPLDPEQREWRARTCQTLRNVLNG